jgi:hypothetical protein
MSFVLLLQFSIAIVNGLAEASQHGIERKKYRVKGDIDDLS